MSATVTSSELVYDPHDRATILDPHPLFRRMRKEAPLYRNDELGFYAVSRFDDTERVLLNRDTFVSRRGVTVDLLKLGIDMPPGTLIFEDPPTHGIHRALLSRMFTPRRVSSLEPEIRRLCATLMDPFVGAGGFDVVTEVASEVPMRVISMLLGIPEEDQARIRDHFQGQRDQGDLGTDALLGGIFAEFIDERVDHPSDDIMSMLLNAEFEDENGAKKRLTRDELLAYINIVAGAGNETSRILIGWTAKLLADNSDQRALLVDDPSLIPGAIEEVLRCEPNTLQNCRYTAKDIELHGEVVPAGSIMVTLTMAANRDERYFEDPDRFDVRRKIDHHMSFGFGPHYCLGQALARLEGRVVLEELLQRFPTWEVEPDKAEFMYHADNRGYSSLPLITS